MTCIVVIGNSTGEYDWISPFFKDNSSFDCKLILNEIPEKDKKNIRKDVFLYPNISIIEPFLLARYFLTFLEKVNRKISLPSSLVSFIYSFFYSKMEIVQTKFLFQDYSFRKSLLMSHLKKITTNATLVAFPHAFSLSIPADCQEDVSHKCDVVLQNTKLCTRYKAKENIITGIPMLDSLNLFDVLSNNIIFFTRDNYDHYGTTNNACYNKYFQVLDFLESNKLKVYIKHHPRNRKANQRHKDIEKNFNNITYINSNNEIPLNKYRACLTFFSAASLMLTRHKVPAIDITPYQEDLLSTSLIHHLDEDGVYVTPFCEHGLQSHSLNLNEIMDSKLLGSISQSQSENSKQIFPNSYNNALQNLITK